MCVQSSLCQLWQDLHRRNWKEVWSQITRTQDWSTPSSSSSSSSSSSKQDALSLEAFVAYIKFNRHNKSALTNHATQENHVINWSQETVINTRQRARAFYQMDQRGHTSGRKDNRPWTVIEGSYQLSHAYDRFLDVRLPVVSRTGRTEYQLLLMKASDRGRNVKF